MCLGEILHSIHTSILPVFSSAFSSSICYISRENFFRLEKIQGHSIGILVV